MLAVAKMLLKNQLLEKLTKTRKKKEKQKSDNISHDEHMSMTLTTYQVQHFTFNTSVHKH